ncbi:hypothetical protein B0H14DRAFT_2729040, partial [Mycena olivaceomarginata]
MSCSGTRSATQEQYALLQPARDLQLEMSRVYKIRGSPMQAADMAALVVFYSHAVMSTGTSYVPKSIPRLPRVIIPAFPTSVFRPCQAVFREGWLQRSTKLAPASLDISTRCSSFLPLRWLRSDGLVKGRRNDITVADRVLRLTWPSARCRRRHPAHHWPVPYQHERGRERRPGQQRVLILYHADTALRAF